MTPRISKRREEGREGDQREGLTAFHSISFICFSFFLRDFRSIGVEQEGLHLLP